MGNNDNKTTGSCVVPLLSLEHYNSSKVVVKPHGSL